MTLTRDHAPEFSGGVGQEGALPSLHTLALDQKSGRETPLRDCLTRSRLRAAENTLSAQQWHSHGF